MYRIKNWKRFQHFKKRRPPWIKVYRDILEDPDWHKLSGDQAKCLTMLWLVASEDETKQGLLPLSDKLAFRLRITETKLMSLLAGLSDWVYQDDITMISQRHQDDTPEGEGETEGEAKTEEKEINKEKGKSQEKQDLFQFWIQTCGMGPPDPQFTKERRKLLQARINDGYNLDALAMAIEGCSRTPHNQGKNDRGQKFMKWELILRDAEKVDYFIANYHAYGKERK